MELFIYFILGIWLLLIILRNARNPQDIEKFGRKYDHLKLLPRYDFFTEFPRYFELQYLSFSNSKWQSINLNHQTKWYHFFWNLAFFRRYLTYTAINNLVFNIEKTGDNHSFDVSRYYAYKHLVIFLLPYEVRQFRIIEYDISKRIENNDYCIIYTSTLNNESTC